MTYRGPGFLAVVWFGPPPPVTPLSRQWVVPLSQFTCVSPIGLTDGRGCRGVAKAYTAARKPGHLSNIHYSLRCVDPAVVVALSRQDLGRPLASYLMSVMCRRFLINILIFFPVNWSWERFQQPAFIIYCFSWKNLIIYVLHICTSILLLHSGNFQKNCIQLVCPFNVPVLVVFHCSEYGNP